MELNEHLKDQGIPAFFPVSFRQVIILIPILTTLHILVGSWPWSHAGGDVIDGVFWKYVS